MLDALNMLLPGGTAIAAGKKQQKNYQKNLKKIEKFQV